MKPVGNHWLPLRKKEMSAAEEHEGVIKFKLNCLGPITEVDWLGPLTSLRCKAHKLGFLGIDQQGIGYGNLSCRSGERDIFVTASQTSGKDEFTALDLCKIPIDRSEEAVLPYYGSKAPSSETMTHLAAYAGNPEVNWILHLHDSALFEMDSGFSTPADVGYGTKEMAEAVKNISALVSEFPQLVKMQGHLDGLLLIANSYEEIEAWLDSF